ncbi:WD40 repeat domain-containing protein [Janthinobacterium lividum]|uniref:WD40 repeat domain-containing protein n=1 Tax=Janthinobacterium lividum TaxID=29581 RepID=A0ABU0XS92_9BURK|nr:WD40 repeat domain-containing protein [Janthinobacterium lividum]MDQ4625839.1 WD40 repeat domain-containing protein [Janthinobacterium lividum]MDQ4672558.1 WD40 repeat domain-containing protein [Janthinobacterium lividum]
MRRVPPGTPVTATRKPLKLGCSYGVQFSPDGTRLAVLGRDLVLWDVAARTKLWRGKFIAHMSGMAFSPDGSRLAIKSTTGQLAVVDANAGQLLFNFQNKKDGEGCGPAWSPCGQYLADGGWDGRLRVRDAQTGEALFTQAHPGEMLRGMWAIDGGRRLLLLHGVKSVEEGQVQPPDYCSVWDWPLQAGAGRVVLSLPKLASCAPSPDGTLLAVLHYADAQECLSVHALDDGRQLATVPVEAGGGTGDALRWLPDGGALGRIGKGKLLSYAWPGLGVLAEHAVAYPCALDFLPGTSLAAIGSWEAGMLMDLNLHKEAA